MNFHLSTVNIPLSVQHVHQGWWGPLCHTHKEKKKKNKGEKLSHSSGLAIWHTIGIRENGFVAERTLYVWHVNYFNSWSHHIFSPNGDDESHSARTTFPGILNSVKARRTITSSKSFRQDGRISVRSFISSNSPPWGQRCLVHGPFGSILLDPGFHHWIQIRWINSASDNSATSLPDNLFWRPSYFSPTANRTTHMNISFLIYCLIHGPLGLHF